MKIETERLILREFLLEDASSMAAYWRDPRYQRFYEETKDIDEWAAENLGGFTALPAPGAPWIEHGRGALLLPQAAGTDGMYVLALTH